MAAQQNSATEIKVRAERRCGELLARTAKNTGAAGVGPIAVERCDRNAAPTLADMGLTKSESSRYQQLAAMPSEHFETAVATAETTAGEVTTAFMVREACELEQRATSDVRLSGRVSPSASSVPEPTPCCEDRAARETPVAARQAGARPGRRWT